MDFFDNRKPPLCAMVAAKTSDEAIAQITNATYEGAEAISIPFCQLKAEYKTDDELKRIFAACGDLPTYITCYKTAENKDLTYEECAELILKAVELGATVVDVPGDFFEGSTKNGMSFKPETVAEQMKLIDEIHKRGGQVLVSCHNSEFIGKEETLRYAKAQVERGADIVKIVGWCADDDMFVENVAIIKMLKKEIEKPVLYLANGNLKLCRLIRQIGPALGVCMYLCVQHHTIYHTKAQVQLRTAKLIRDSLIF